MEKIERKKNTYKYKSILRMVLIYENRTKMSKISFLRGTAQNVYVHASTVC